MPEGYGHKKDTHENEHLQPHPGVYAVYNCREASDFTAVMSGGNTGYCDDPEECIADNFAYAMMNRTDLPNQKLLEDAPDGSFVTCITVPRFTYDGFQMLQKEEITRLYPETAEFWQ